MTEGICFYLYPVSFLLFLELVSSYLGIALIAFLFFSFLFFFYDLFFYFRELENRQTHCGGSGTGTESQADSPMSVELLAGLHLCGPMRS